MSHFLHVSHTALLGFFELIKLDLMMDMLDKGKAKVS